MNKRALVAILAKARDGVVYKRGAKCPVCGAKAKVITTRKWDDGTRIRYHRCSNEDCVVHSLDVNVKSVESKKVA